ncbi:MAG: HAD family hydrolase [Candidatus Gastranaerophilales bacterium]|nr:HAD family hydrolase [Candidatus Gastranaerophilales bacterium]
MTKIKLWVSDIDGTLMNYDSSYTPRMANLIEKINKSDCKLVLATGRMFMGADFVAQKFNLNNPVICYQGAVVRTKEKILWQKPIKNELAYEIINYLKEKNIHTHVYNNDILYIEDDNKRIMSAYCDNRGTTYEVIEDFNQLKLNNVPKILGVIEDKNLMQEIKNELSKKYKNILTIVQSSPIYLEINDIEASKGHALDFLKEYWNLKDNQVIASGDQDNDIELLEHAGNKVCVGSNSQKLKEIANYHCKDVNSDELVDLIERLVLCE